MEPSAKEGWKNQLHEEGDEKGRRIKMEMREDENEGR